MYIFDDMYAAIRSAREAPSPDRRASSPRHESVGIGPNSSKMINALSKLKWMVVGENYEIETATFWKAPKQYGGPDASQIQTRSSSSPARIRREGRHFHHSARWLQWKWKAIDPPGQAKTTGILSRILLAVRDLYKKEGGAFAEQVLNVSWNYTNPVNPDLAEVLKEITARRSPT